MTFTTATIDDVALIQNLAGEVWWPTYGPIQPKEKVEFLFQKFYSHAALANAIKANEQEFVILVDEGSAKGFASFGQHPTQADTFKMYKLYVLPSTHGKGYGRALLDEIKRRARIKMAHATHLELNVYRGNPALKFYEKMGFKIIAEVNEPVGDFFFEDYVMSVSL